MLGYREPPEGVNPVVYDLVDGKPVRKPIDVARRLLAEAGYPDGRNARTGAPLVLYYDSMTGGGSNPQFDWMRRQLAKLGVQLDVRATDYNRFQDKMRRGSAQIFFWGRNARLSGREYDKLFEQMKLLDDGPEKERLIARMVAIVQRDAPWMFGYFPMSGGAYQQWVGNAKPTQMVRNILQYSWTCAPPTTTAGQMRRGSAQIFFWGWNADYPDAETSCSCCMANAKAKTGGENAANSRAAPTTSSSSR